MQPHSLVLRPDSGYERFAVRRHRYSLLGRWAKGELLWLSIRKALPPDMKGIRLGCEIDPFSVRRPSARTTGAIGRANYLSVICALEWSDAAGQNFALTAHLNNEYPSAIRRKVGMVSHAAFGRGHVDVPAVAAAFVCGHHHHMQPFVDLGEEQPLSAFDPC